MTQPIIRNTSASFQCLPPDAAPLDTQSSPSPSSSASRHVSVDSDHATREFIDFLKPLKSGREIFKQCRAFTETMVYKRVSFSCAADKFWCVFMGEILLFTSQLTGNNVGGWDQRLLNEGERVDVLFQRYNKTE